MAGANAGWSVYVLRSRSSGRTYVGIALDVRRRLAQHNGKLPGGAKSTRAGRPWRVGKIFGPYDSRGQAQRVEAAVKRLRGPARLRFRG
ncbi:MAG: GIY-YIG nuclease family protein [Nannocystaceae bacterium]